MTIPGQDHSLSPRPVDDDHASSDVGPRGCPFLLAESGGWRLDVPSKDHRCTAVSPTAALSPEKQSRLCLTAAFPSCATYLASMEARGARLGAPAADHATRWGLARTTAVIEDVGGVRSRVVGVVTDRRRWPAVPAVLLLTGLVVLGFSGLRGAPASVVASPSPTSPSLATPTPRATEAPPTGGTAPTAASTAAATVRPSTAPSTAGPVASFRTYVVQGGDTLSGIASKFGTTSRAIADLNGIKTTTTLHSGDVLKIPNT